MKCRRKAVVASTAHDAVALVRYIEAFADRASGWEFPAEKSAKYEQTCGSPSCCIVTASNALPRAAIHLSVPREGARSLEVTNIVPLVAYQLGVDEYNAILVAFGRALRASGRRDAIPLRVTLSKADVRLADIVTGRPWKYLQRFLAAHPLSGHPSDMQRLDEFICSLSRYAKKHVNLETFQLLLMEELGWSKEDASWVRSRVDVGLDVLSINKGFRA